MTIVLLNSFQRLICHLNFDRQRKALSPAFSNAAIRKLTPVFYDAAYKVCKLR